MLSTPNKALTALVTAALAATVPAVVAAPPAAVAAAPQRVDPVVMQIIAHQDDDLFFMNPDVDDSITAGLPSITVFLTAGQLTGDGATDGQRARNRQRGIQNAYATMASAADGDDSTQLEWTGTPWRVGDRTAELYLLRSRPDVMLIFLNLHDGSLLNIDTGGTDDTVVPTGGVVTAPVRYDRADVVRTLRTIMSIYRPTVLRTHDAEPDRRYTPDHTDHVTTGRFAREAAAGYPYPLVEVHYRDYDTADVPTNLSPAQVSRKARILAEYYRYDTAMRDSGSGAAWLSRMYHRWPQGTGWVNRNERQELQAFFVRNGAAYHHPEQAGLWLGARRLADPGGRLAPGLSVARHADGRLEVFARRLAGHRIVSLSQEAPNGPFRGSWTDLGNPNTGFGNEDMVGTPAAAVDGDGRLRVFVKNGGGGLSALRQVTAGGAWERVWDDLGGSDLQDGLSAVTTPQGRVEVFAATRGAVLRWYQTRADATLVRDAAFRSAVPAGPPRATVDRQGRLAVAYRRAGTATMMLSTQAGTTPTAAWSEPADLGGAGLFEPGTVLAPDGRLMMFARQGGGVAASRQAGGDGFGPWQALDGGTLGPPAAVLDGSGRAAVFSVGATGLSVLRQDATGADQPFSVWQDLGL